jgi:hypothetical protein
MSLEHNASILLMIGIMAAILASLHMETADDLFGTPQRSPRTDKID